MLLYRNAKEFTTGAWAVKQRIFHVGEFLLGSASLALGTLRVGSLIERMTILSFAMRAHF
jgi:hypothetical protein